MSKLAVTFLAALALSGVALAQTDEYQVGYYANTSLGGVLNLNNTGETRPNSICVNVYVFNPDATSMLSCCACPLAPNALAHLNVIQDLNGNNLIPQTPNSISVAVVASQQAVCDASTPTAIDLVHGLRAWGTTFHALPTTPVTVGVTEDAFSNSSLGTNELTYLTSTCGFNQANGSGHGICRTCPLRNGALGASKQ